MLASAAEQAPLTGGQDIIQAPGLGRVAAAFIIVAALAVAAVVALRRVLPRMTGVPLSGKALRILDRANLGPGTRVHLVQVEDEKVLVAESRGGVTIAVLGKTASVVQP
jgi:flagellar biogenesis protein FliO